MSLPELEGEERRRREAGFGLHAAAGVEGGGAPPWGEGHHRRLPAPGSGGEGEEEPGSILPATGSDFPAAGSGLLGRMVLVRSTLVRRKVRVAAYNM